MTRLAWVDSLVILAFGAAAAQAQPPNTQVGFTVSGLSPKFKPGIRDYVVRCRDQPVTVNAHVSAPWEAAIGKHPYATGDYRAPVRVATGQEFTIAVRQTGDTTVFAYHISCLPSEFPTYTFKRYGPVSPRFFSVDQEFVPGDTRYAIVFDDHGVPIWWYHLPARDPRVLPNGEVTWFD